jgi:hypothetical protein
MAIAGHVSPKMLRHYSHVRLQAKRTALDALSMRRADAVNLEGKRGSYDTKQRREAEQVRQVIENLVELVGIATLGSIDIM